MTTRAAWQNRIVGTGSQPASAFLANPQNWRLHPQAQQDALEGVLSSVGWVTGVIVNVRTGHLVDGHQRVLSAMKQGDETPVPYIEVDLSPEEEALVLATLDPISAMAGADKAQLDGLLRDVQSDDARVQQMLATLAQEHGITPPDDEHHERQHVVAQFNILITCADEAEQSTLLERFIAEGITCRLDTKRP